MSAVLKDPLDHGVMRVRDLDDVLAIENAVYTHPWTRGNFIDSLNAGYQCGTIRIGGRLAGYFILIVAVGEAHLLNLSVAAADQRKGIGSTLLVEVMRIARERGAKHLFLEVRPSNHPALSLYARFGFRRISERRGYYPAAEGRENALVLTVDV